MPLAPFLRLLIVVTISWLIAPQVDAQSSHSRYVAPRFTQSPRAKLLRCQAGCSTDCDCLESDTTSVVTPPIAAGVPASDAETSDAPLTLPTVADDPEATAETTDHPADPSTSSLPSVSNDRRRQERNAAVEELREAILRRLLEDKRQTSAAPADIARRSTGVEIGVPHADPAAPRPPEIPRRIELPLPAEPSGAPDPTPAIVLQPTPPVDLPDAQPADRENREQRDMFGLDGIPLVDGPVDRVALADNFYAEGEFTIALRMYSEVRLTELPVDQQYWVQFQQASCMRRLGDRDAARKIYRILAGRKDGGWLAGVSTWWLNRMEERAQLEKQIGRMDAHLAELKESWNEPENF